MAPFSAIKVWYLFIYKQQITLHAVISKSSPVDNSCMNKISETFITNIVPWRVSQAVYRNMNRNVTKHIVTPLVITMSTRQIWGIWKLRPAYNPETHNLGQNWWCFVPCDLEIWWMTLENNRAPLLCCFKLCATFHSHRWIRTGVAVRKRPIWVKFDDF